MTDRTSPEYIREVAADATNGEFLRALADRIEELEAAAIDAIGRMQTEGLDATAEYNGLWAAVAASRGIDEIAMRRAALGDTGKNE